MARDPKYDILFEPIKIGPKTMKNRFYVVPHCIGAGSDKPGGQAAFRGMRAEGGWGATCTEYCSIDPDSDDTPRVHARLWDDGDVINLRHLTDTCHEHGALAGCEMWHGGPHAPCMDTRHVPMSPSPFSSNFENRTYPHEADEDEVKQLVQMYVEGAKRAEQAGFDLVYVYGSHSYLPLQFLSPYYNKRTDKYGGDIENRARFWLECLEGVKNAVGANCGVVTRFAIDTIMGTSGIQAGEDGMKFVEIVTREGLTDLWDVNISDIAEWGEDAGPSRFYKANHQRPWVKDVKGVAKVPVLTVGRITSPDDMVDIIKSGQADIIGAARPSIADPFLPRKIEEGRLDEIRECIGCNMCISRWEIGGPPLVCTQNATAMEEYRRGWHPEKFEKVPEEASVLVVGAGPSGMECARVLGERGFEVHLVEADAEVGGCMKDIQRYPGLSEWGRVVSYRQIQLDRLKNVEIHTKTRLTTDDVLGYGADKVVIASGSYWAGNGHNSVDHETIANVDSSQAQFCTPEQVMAGKEVGDRVVVLDADGYFTGVGMAELLKDQGKDVTIITQLGAVAPYTEFTLEGPNLHRMLHEKKIRQMTGHWLEEIEVGNEVRVRAYNLSRDGYRRTTEPRVGEAPRTQGTEHEDLMVDTVVLCTARLSNDGLFRELKARKDEWEKNEIQGIYLSGDAYAPRYIADAIFEGHRIARELESANPQRPLPYIRERQIWGQENMPKLR
jgi:dimethylamine/trimethylamine dehydrogenase